jgi:DNA-binding MurR/RpiR family transcriptional regulator
VSAKRIVQSLAELNAMTKEHLIIAQHIMDHPELTYGQIASELEVSRHTVLRVAREAGMRRPRGVKLRLKVPS